MGNVAVCPSFFVTIVFTHFKVRARRDHIKSNSASKKILELAFEGRDVFQPSNVPLSTSVPGDSGFKVLKVCVCACMCLCVFGSAVSGISSMAVTS